MHARTLRIALIMHSTRSDNLGVGALTVAEVDILREISREIGRAVEITVLDWKDPRAPYVSGPDVSIVEIDGKFMASPVGYFAVARRSDLVIDIGAGDSFADIYGSRRLKRMFLLKFLTHLAGTPLVLAPQTIGPFTKGWSKALARITLRRSSIVATRDRMSTEAARALGRSDVIEASDVALRLPFHPAPSKQSGGLMRVGMNVSGLLMTGGYSGNNEFGLTSDYPELIRDLIRHFESCSVGCVVHLVPHVIVAGGRMAGEDDRRACEALVEEFPRCVLAPAFASPSEAKSYISGLDFFMGARMHACIAAFSTGVPVVPMAYSRKFEGLFGSLGYRRTVDCTREANAEIFGKIVAAFEDRATLAAEGEAALREGLCRLKQYETGLKRELERIATPEG